MKSRSTGYILIFLLGVFTLSNYVNQTDGYLIISSFTVSFSAYYLLLKNRQFSFSTLITIGLIARIICFFSLPALSDDFYRFLWDGYIYNHGINPYQATPANLSVESEYANALLASMNSPDYYSVYPPFLQYIFAFTQWLGNESVVSSVFFLRLILLGAEIITLLLGYQIVKKLKILKYQLLWYWLNPLIIIEIIGNVHPEGLIIPFIFAAILFFINLSPIISGIGWGAAFAIKLNPILLFIPFLKSASRQIRLLIGFFIPVIISGFAIWDLKSVTAIWESINLYFSSFEFNASIYYLVREIGIWISGSNLITYIGPLLALSFIIIYSYQLMMIKRGKESINSLIVRCIIIWMVYLFLSTTVHPWYIIPIIALSSLTQMRSPLIWSFLIVLSYMHYHSGMFKEYYSLIALEYLIVIISFFLDIKEMKKSE